MNCQSCNRPITVYLIALKNGTPQKASLCEDCAKKQGITYHLPLPLSQKILDKTSNLTNSLTPEKNITCPGCGLTTKQLLKKRILGCKQCYLIFESTLDKLIKKLHNNANQHQGKLGKKSALLNQITTEITRLEKTLQACIDSEEYEQAAVLRDEINKQKAQLDREKEQVSYTSTTHESP